MLGHADMIYYSDGNGNAAVPPHNTVVAGGTANAGKVDEVENPNPATGTNNWYCGRWLRWWIVWIGPLTAAAPIQQLRRRKSARRCSHPQPT
jgi:hypothetical protein